VPASHRGGPRPWDERVKVRSQGGENKAGIYPQQFERDVMVVRRWRKKAGLAGGELEGRKRWFECLNMYFF